MESTITQRDYVSVPIAAWRGMLNTDKKGKPDEGAARALAGMVCYVGAVWDADGSTLARMLSISLNPPWADKYIGTPAKRKKYIHMYGERPIYASVFVDRLAELWRIYYDTEEYTDSERYDILRLQIFYWALKSINNTGKPQCTTVHHIIARMAGYSNMAAMVEAMHNGEENGTLAVLLTKSERWQRQWVQDLCVEAASEIGNVRFFRAKKGVVFTTRKYLLSTSS